MPKTHFSKMSKTNPHSLRFHLHVLSLLFLALPFRANSQTTESEQDILLKLKLHWSNPPSISHWLPPSDHCAWPEIICADGSVTGIKLVDKNITETIPPFICDLKNLTLLGVQNNYIPGPFPAALYDCLKLEYLDLSQNYFVGRIPNDVHRLSPRLRFLNLAANNFTGDIPVSVSRLPELRTLSLYQNLFNGTFPPEIGNLKNLENLGLAFNDFIPSPIPSSFTQLKNLKIFYMTETKLIGEIPQGIQNLTELQFLDLSENELVGNIPGDLFLLKNLTEIYLYKNKLSGLIPQSIQALDMRIIDLSSNNLTGPIPEDFGKLTKLLNLTLAFNQLSGELAASIGRLPELMEIRIFSNNLSGKLPPDFGKYSMLRSFQVAENHFTGELPKNLCANGVLLDVIVFKNNLTGELPESLGNCSSLVGIQIFDNRFSGKFPDALWSLEDLTKLRISQNSFSGQLPEKMGRNLSLVEISNNQFSGEIPVGIASWKNLNVFRASDNLLTGSIPHELTALPTLETLLLNGNQLSGHFPSKIVSWNSLTTLNLSQNQLSGEIPPEIWRLPDLIFLDLSENKFSGELPSSIGFLRIVSLNLSSNSFTGSIPGEFENAVFNRSFLNNPGLCAKNPALGINICQSKSKKSSKLSPKLIAILATALALVFVIAAIITFLTIRNYRKRKQRADSTWNLIPFQKLSFKESDILLNLTENNVIGSGRSGKVYRVAVNRSENVAVKKIWSNKKLENKLDKDFLAEVQILGTIRHSNVVRLLCSISNKESELLVYEYLENRSLDLWLHGKRRKSSAISASSSVRDMVLDWPKRMQIAVGAARGLCYMHHECSPPIVHRDLKSSNILLDSQYNAKIADFGLARMLVGHGEFHTIASTVAGSFGYIAPEYGVTRKLNEKIDMYSFGVILLELATGREASYGDETTSLAGWAWRHFQEGKPVVEALDEEIREARFLDEMTLVFRLGIICTGSLPSNRPSIKFVLQMLLRQPVCKTADTPLIEVLQQP